MPKTIVYCRTRFIGFHCWPDAPKELSYLSELHRHEFHVEVAVNVKHDNRGVEFQTLRFHVDQCIQSLKVYSPREPQFGDDEYVEDYSQSCEMIAQFILEGISRTYGYSVEYVDVSEDGENGARVHYGN